MGILERNLCVVKSAFHVLSVLQIDVIILKELSFSSYSPTDFLSGLRQTASVATYNISIMPTSLLQVMGTED